MPAHIDLSPLLALLTGVPTAQSQTNPDYAPYTDPVTGETSQSGASTGQTPFITPSKWQHLVWGPQSSQIDTLNNQAVSGPTMADIANQTRINVAKKNIGAMNPALVPQGETPESMAVEGYGQFNNPSDIREQNKNIGYMRGNGTDLDVALAHNVATAGSEEAANRARLAATSGALGNPEAAAGTEALGLQTQAGEYGGEYALQPGKFNRLALENRLGAEQAGSELSLLPARTGLQRTVLGNEQATASQTAADRPYVTGAQRGEDIQRYIGAENMPIQAPFSNRINIDEGTVNPLSKNEFGANPYLMQFAGIKDIQNFAGPQTQSLTLPNGDKITVPVANPLQRQTESVLQGRSMNPPLGGGTNNVTRTATPSASDAGKMAPPIPTESSSTTLPVTPSMNSLLTRDESMTNPSSIKSEANSHQSISDEISKITSKYQGKGIFKMSDEDIARLKVLTNALSEAQ